MSDYDIIVVGAGPAGLACAIFGARGGSRVLIVEKQPLIGGTLLASPGHFAAGGTKRQIERGIADTAEAHLKDVLRISSRTAREDLVRLALAHSTWLVDWLQDEGFEFAPDSPRILREHEPYSAPRTYWGVEGGRSVLKVFSRLVQPLIDAGAITLALNAKLKALLTDDGKVVGAQYAQGGKVHTARASRGVVLATGGFAASPELFEEIEGFPLVSAAPGHATGDGLEAARGLGAKLSGRGTFLPTFGGLPHPDAPRQTLWNDRPLLIAKERPPHEIYVDRFGKRWIAEDEESIQAKERALLKTDGLTFFTVFDERGLETSGPMIEGWSKEDLKERAGRRAGVFTATTVEELAGKAGIDAFGLATTLARYNGYVRTGSDPDFGRKFLPAPIETSPFYALKNHGVTAATFSGVDVDFSMRVRREDGSTIAGLYAVGEILGAAATQGSSFCDGMLMGPAIVFGRLVGERLALPESAITGPTAEVPRPESISVQETREQPRPEPELSHPTVEIPRIKF